LKDKAKLKTPKRDLISEIVENEEEPEEEEEGDREDKREHVKRRRLTFAERLDRLEWKMSRELLKRDKERKQDYIT